VTRQDRDLAIADNLAYVEAVIAAVRRDHRTTDTIVYAGFSQGVAMAYRATAFVRSPPASGAILLAGDVPPDVAPHLAELPPLLIGRGTADEWYTETKAAADATVFQQTGVQPTVHVFEGGHVWDPSFTARAGTFLDTMNR